MWQEVERRIADNEADADLPFAPMRRSILAELKESTVTPAHATKKMAAFKLPGDVILLWELTSPSLNFFVAAPLKDSLNAAGFQGEPRPFDHDKLPNGGRHSALSLDWSFGQEDCVCVKINDAADAIRLVSALSPETAIAAKPAFSRDQIEAAMKALDDYRSTGANAEIFGAFGEPRDYWVRSTDEGKIGVYPTKPLVGFILKKTELNGGWGQKSDAAAQLHNSGYIIVDQNDRPVTVPDQYQHLMRGADRVRFVALNYFIEPARDRGDVQVAVRVGDVSANLFPNHHYRNVWQALRGKSFQDLAKVPPPTQTGVDESSATVLTYQLFTTKKQSAMTPDTTIQTSTTNLILYGPPGTGKTYYTAWEAIRLCLGNAAAERFRGDEKRVALMAEYRRLENEGRIEFVTFHQSMSYEEFVEGLRPETQSAKRQELDADELDSAGFRLKVEDGIFKRICERARLDPGEDSGDRRLDRARPIFKVALGRRFQEEAQINEALDASEIRHGWSGKIDWSDERFEDWEEIKTELEKRTGKEVSSHAGELVCTYSFRADMQVGDYVVVSDGRDRMRAFGTITSDYFFEADAEHHPHRRRVKWLWRDDQGTERTRFYANGFRQHTVYKLNGALVDWDGLEELVFGADRSIPAEGARHHVLIIDEINRANISKVLGELITLLEPDKRLGMANEIRLTLPYSKKRFAVPPNLHIIATMNTADRSIALLDTALRRRFTFRELMPDPDVLPADVEGINLQKLLRTINERIEYLFDREHQIGHAYFTDCDSRATIEEVMRYKVIPLLAEYFYEDWSKVAAVLGEAAQDNPRFLSREIMTAPSGLDTDTVSGARYRWRILPHVNGDKDGSFDFTEFEV